MSTICICYDLNRPGQNYSSLIEAIKNCGTTWCHCPASTWFVVTSMSATQVRDLLRQHVDSGDELLVFPVGSNAAWQGISDECAAWFRNNWNAG